MKKSILILVLSITAICSFSQEMNNDSSNLNYRKLYAYCLDGNITAALQMLASNNPEQFTATDIAFKTEFEKRFRDSEDNSNYLENKKSGISSLLKIYQHYWRKSLLDNSTSYDQALVDKVVNYLKYNYQPASDLTANIDSINVYLTRFIQSKNLHTTGFGKTGKFYDLLIWETEKDTSYSFRLLKEQTSARVILMDNFITLGWEEYATLEKYYPGGWSTKEALYCVLKAYDRNNETFLISYLAHESRHFADFKLFAKLSSADLEYRAKLTELSLAKKTLYGLIAFFIRNANYHSGNGHSVAAYCVIRDLSKALFKADFNKDTNSWEKISIKKINKAASTLLKKNTRALKKAGPDVERFI